MGRLNRFKAALLKALAEFANVTTDKGILAWDGDDDLKVGDQVYIEDAEGNRTPAEDGDYKTDDNKTIVVVDGKVSEIKDPETDVEPTEGETTEETPAEMASVATDKGDLLYEGELAVGTEVFVADEEGNQTAAPDGDYTLENGNVVKVAEGKVSEIVEAEPAEEAAPADETAAIKAQRKAKAEAFGMSYNDKMRKMCDAIEALGYEYPWIIDAGDDYCIADMWSQIMRFPATWEGENVTLGTPEEVKVAYVPVDFDVDSAFGLKSENEELKKQIAELSAQPLAKPAHDVVTTTQTFEKTGDKGLDRLSSIMRK